MKTRQYFGVSRLTRFLHNTRSSASFHISHNLSLSIPLDRQIAVLLAFHVIPPLTFPYKIVLALVHFAFTTSPNNLNLLFSDRSVFVDDTEIAFLRHWCCDITNEYFHQSDQVFVFWCTRLRDEGSTFTINIWVQTTKSLSQILGTWIVRIVVARWRIPCVAYYV